MKTLQEYKELLKSKEREFDKVLLLSLTEYDILLQIGKGKPTKQITSKNKVVATKTIESHKQHIKSKLSLNYAVELQTFAARYIMFCELTDAKRETLSQAKTVGYFKYD